MRKQMYQAAEEAYEAALAAYPDDNDEYAGISTVKKKLEECREQAELQGASVKIQAVFRKRQATKFVSEKKKAADAEAERLAGLTAEQRADEREAKRLQKMSEREALEAAAAEDRAAVEAFQDNDPAKPGVLRKERNNFQKTIVKILDARGWMYLTIFNTTYALFAQDIAMWLLPKGADFAIAFLTFLVFMCFLFEFAGNLYGGREYGAKVHAHEIMDMFFWLDLIGTFSLIPDFLIVFTGEELEVPDYVILARVARAARIGARLSRLTKLFRIAAHHDNPDPYAHLKTDEEVAADASADVDVDVETAVDPEPAAEAEEKEMEEQVAHSIGDKVTEGISKRVIALVIILLVFVPIFTYQEPRGGIRKTKSDMIYMAHSMKRMDPNLTGNGKCVHDGTKWKCSCLDNDGQVLPDEAQTCPLVTEYHQSMQQLLSYQGDNVIYMTWDRDLPGLKPRDCKSWSCIGNSATLAPTLVYNQPIFDELRKSEVRKYGDDDLDPHQEPIPDSYEFYRIEMWIDYRLKTQAEAFTNIVYMLVVSAIFALASLVFMMDLNRLVIEPTENMSGAMRMVSEKLLDLGGEVGPDGEAAYIESSITKIVSLLNVSFGAAGTRIVSANMKPGSSEIQPLVPGAKVSGIYAFCDIREFTASTEALQERIVVFVNEFGRITHENCIKTGGAPNKNVGDAFLCCWLDGNNGEPPAADEALLSYRRAIMDIRTSETLNALSQDRKIVERFPPNKQEFGQYYPRMGIGLNYGESIEGAIGTSKKLDASYLGPDVELADVLEAATKVYKTPILMTEMFYMLLSENQQQTCRKVDKIQWEDGEPFWLYAANMSCDALGNYFNPDVVDDVYEIAIDERAQQNLMFGKDGAENPRENDERWRKLVNEWDAGFEAAVDLYVDGKWPEAQAALVSTLLRVLTGALVASFARFCFDALC